MPFVSKVHPRSPSRPAVHGPAPTARSDRVLKQSAWGIRAVCFKSLSQQAVRASHPRPALIDFWNYQREESVPSVSKVHPSSSSRPAVHGPPPRPALTFISKVHPGGPSRTSATARSHELLKQTAPHMAEFAHERHSSLNEHLTS